LSRTGYPTIAPEVVANREIDSIELSKSLRLSPSQGKLTALLAAGKSLNIVAEDLDITLATARWHLREIFKRTGTHSQPELVRLAEAACPPNEK
jgi:DNA-binding CsgD family transcriptional regulator